jgi:hypothetical protein
MSSGSAAWVFVISALAKMLAQPGTDILHIKARSPIEAVAMRLLTEEIREILAQPPA